MRPRELLAAGTVMAAFFGLASTATAGSPTVSLGSVGTIEYLKNSNDEVLTQDGRTADCDAGDEVVGGGGAISGNTANSFLNATHPETGPAWTTEGRTTGVRERTVTTFAICGEQSAVFTSAATTFPSPPDPQSFQTDFAGPCTGNETEVGSGIDVSSGDVRLIRNRPPPPTGSGWITAENVHATQAASATFWTGCSSGYTAATKTAKTKVRAGDAGTAAASCGRRQAVIAGGFESVREGVPVRSTWLTSTRPFDSKEDRRKVPDDGWRATVHNGSGGKIVLRAYAICAGL